MSALVESDPRLWDSIGDPADFCHYTVAEEPFPSQVPMLCGLLLNPEDYEPESLNLPSLRPTRGILPVTPSNR